MSPCYLLDLRAGDGLPVHEIEQALKICHGKAQLKLVEDLRKAKYVDLLAAYPNITYRPGRARFTGNGTEVDVGGTAYRPGNAALAEYLGSEGLTVREGVGYRNIERYSNAAMPEVVFTDPQFATAGMTEAQARAKGFKVRTSIIRLDNVPRFIATFDTRGLIKLVADADTDRLLGATILAPEAGDSIQTVVMALKAGLTTQDLADTIFPYLNAVEGLKLAAQGFTKDVNKLSCCAG